MLDCIKTGAYCYVEEYGEYVYGDLFLLGQYYVIRVCAIDHKPINDMTPINAKMVQVYNWFDKEKTSQQQNSTVIGAYLSNFSYTGIPVSEVFING